MKFTETYKLRTILVDGNNTLAAAKGKAVDTLREGGHESSPLKQSTRKAQQIYVPKRISKSMDKGAYIELIQADKKKLQAVSYSNSRYPANIKLDLRHKNISGTYNSANIARTLSQTCSQNFTKLLKILKSVSSPWITFDGLLLVVTFNTPTYNAIPYLEGIYRY